MGFLIVFFLISSPLAFDHTHARFDQVLKKRVHSREAQNLVDYKGLKKAPQNLEHYLQELSGVSQTDYQKWTAQEKISFLINAYNAFTLKWILLHHPVSSIKNTAFFSPWKKKFFIFLEKKRSLGYIEHKKLRKDFKDPRIHYALVCASISCPNLQKFAYTPSLLEKQLHRAEKEFLSDPQKNRYVREKNQLHLSKIFKWYAKDFDSLGGVKNYMIKKMKIGPMAPSLHYLDYDWGLNEWK